MLTIYRNILICAWSACEIGRSYRFSMKNFCVCIHVCICICIYIINDFFSLFVLFVIFVCTWYIYSWYMNKRGLCWNGHKKTVKSHVENEKQRRHTKHSPKNIIRHFTNMWLCMLFIWYGVCYVFLSLMIFVANSRKVGIS